MIEVGSYQLRPYQERAYREVQRLYTYGRRRILAVSPTGSGKTLMASTLIHNCVRKGGRVLFLADRRILVHQASAKLTECGVPHSIFMAGHPFQKSRVTVASRDTMYARCYKRKVRQAEYEGLVIDEELDLQPKPEADLVIVDEAHLSLAPAYLEIFKSYPDAVFVGYTATPTRTDGKGLGMFWDSLFQAAYYKELIDAGHLVKTKVFAPSIPDLGAIPLGPNGEYNPDAVEEVMDKDNMVGDVVRNWLELARLPDGNYRRTVVFATGVAHSIHLRDEFKKAGIPAAHMDGETPPAERKDILARLESGDIQVVTNCQVLDTGWDQPSVSCCVLAKPTTSVATYRQMAGRVQRPCPGKEDALLIDHAGAVFVHGFPDDDNAVEWSLDHVAVTPQKGLSHNPDGSVSILSRDNRDPIGCPDCGAERWDGAVCPHCGARAIRVGREIEMVNAALRPLTEKDVRPKRKRRNIGPLQRAWNKSLGRCANSGRTFKQAIHLFHRETGEWPDSTYGCFPEKDQLSCKVQDVYPGFRSKRG